MRALSQKYMGLGGYSKEQMFQDTSFKDEAKHDVLLDNFMNAQCMISVPGPFFHLFLGMSMSD